MSTSENISLWKKKAEIDYIPLFISLWLSLNAWMKDRFTEQTDRSRLELLKRGRHPVFDRFSELIQSDDANGKMFKGSIGELHRALLNAHISYDRNTDRILGLGCCAIAWNDGDPEFESVLKESNEPGKLQIDSSLWVDRDPERLFAAYAEIVYQVRCALLHGDLAPITQNERVIKHLYLTFSMVMERV